MDAIRKLQRTTESDYAYESTAVRGFAKETCKGYAAATDGWRARSSASPELRHGSPSRTSCSPLVRASQSDLGPRRILSGVCALEKFGRITPLVVCMDWKLMEAVDSFYESVWGSSTKYWASMGCLRAVCRLCSSAAEWEPTALSAISMCLGLWAKEAITVSLEDGEFHWRCAKGQAGPCSETAPPWGAIWGSFLWLLCARHGFHPGRPAWHESCAALHAHLQELIGCPRSGCTLLRWHAWRRYGAAQLRCLGAPTPALLRWGGWATPQMLRIYPYLGAQWSFRRGGPLVQPQDLHTHTLGW